MRGRGVDRIAENQFGGSSEAFAQLWKSGASAPRQGAIRSEGFGPSGPQGLKAVSLSVRNAALKGPLYRGASGTLVSLAAGLILALCATDAVAQVTFERLTNSTKEPQNWMTYSGDYSGKRFSALDQVNAANAGKLVAKWVYQTGATGKLETTPLVVDGIMYATAQDDRAFALDARTGRPIWMYQRQLPGDIRPSCGRVNRAL